MRRAIDSTLALLLLAAAPASAQITYIPATGYFLQTRDAAGARQFGPMYYAPLSEWVCNKPVAPPAPPTIVTNPEIVVIGDVDRPGRACELNIVTWRASALPTGTRYTLWIGATAEGFNEVAVAPGWPDFVRAINEFNVQPTTSALPAPTGGRLLVP